MPARKNAKKLKEKPILPAMTAAPSGKARTDGNGSGNPTAPTERPVIIAECKISRQILPTDFYIFSTVTELSPFLSNSSR